jgi:hypothetical protein
MPTATGVALASRERALATPADATQRIGLNRRDQKAMCIWFPLWFLDSAMSDYIMIKFTLAGQTLKTNRQNYPCEKLVRYYCSRGSQVIREGKINFLGQVTLTMLRRRPFSLAEEGGKSSRRGLPLDMSFCLNRKYTCPSSLPTNETRARDLGNMEMLL